METINDKIVNGQYLEASFWEQLVNKFWQLAVTKGIDIGVALLILVVGFFLIGKIGELMYLAVEKKSEDPALATFSKRLTRIGLKILLIITVASQVGIETTSFIAALGAMGVAIGLALQGSLSNFAGGVLILVFKPFKVGDVIESGGYTGKVNRIDILHSVLTTFDNKTIFLPNGQVANSSLVNFTLQETRRVDISVGISYTDNVAKAREVVLKLIKADDRILMEPEPMIVVTSFGDSSVNLAVRIWTKTEHYWDVFADMMEGIKVAFEQNSINIPFPQRDIHVYTKGSEN
jgi:small conductance mechanosensitive channel